MSVIIRLQNLPWSANALDIRQYFGGLSIPEGGVHIVGGELGDAFIAFSTDEDARQAFLRNNGKIKEVQISLMLSSRTEMQRVIEQARAKSYAAFMQPTASAPAPTPAPVPAQVPLPSVVPQMIPAAVPEIKKEKDVNEKLNRRDNRRRSRSKSKERDRRDRSRDRKDRRYRDRSRSKSRERKSSRRRDRSRSRNRSRSRERERRNSSKDHRKRSEEKTLIPSFHKDQRKPDIWASQVKPDVISGLQGQAGARPVGFQASLDHPKRNTGSPQTNGFQVPGFSNNENIPRNIRDSWPPSNQGGFSNNRNNDNFNHMDNFSGSDRFRKRGYNRFDQESNSCITLEPFFGGYGDIRKFFHGMFISNRGIKFINDSNGRRTGMVYVQFSNLRTKEDAISMSGRILNGLEVTISHLDDREFEEAVDRYVPQPFEENTNEKFKGRLGPKVFSHKNEEDEPELKDFTCLTVEDLPNYVKDQDILHIFEMYPLVALNVVNRRRGGPVAYVKFGSKEEAKKALEETSSHIVGGKQVTVKPCADHLFEEINKQQDVSLSSPKTEDIGTDCLSVSRLPQKTTDKDIADFFSDIGVIPTKIHLMSNNMGFTGEAYCEFMSTEEATRAVKKNETMLGSASISVIPISRHDMDNILESAFPAPMEQSSMPLTKNPQLSPPHPFSGGNQQQDNFEGPDRPGFFNNRNKFEFDGPPRGQSRFQPPRGGPGSRMRFHGSHMDGEDIPPGCTIYLKNVPYKANTNDILDFFEGFNHTGNVSRRFNPNNTPTDEAKITFYDPDEASRAVDHLQKMKIWDRSIYLRQD